jgi:hypothetical protein
MDVNKSVPVLRIVVPVLSRLLAIGLATDQTRVINVSLSEGASTPFMPGGFPALPPGYAGRTD